MLCRVKRDDSEITVRTLNTAKQKLKNCGQSKKINPKGHLDARPSLPLVIARWNHQPAASCTEHRSCNFGGIAHYLGENVEKVVGCINQEAKNRSKPQRSAVKLLLQCLHGAVAHHHLRVCSLGRNKHLFLLAESSSLMRT